MRVFFHFGEVEHWMMSGSKLMSIVCLPSGGTNANHVLPLQRHRPPLALDRSGLVESLLHHLAEHVLGHAGLLEREAGLRHALADDCDLLAGSPRVRLAVGPFRHVGVLDVEVLLEGDQLLRREVDLIEASPDFSRERVYLLLLYRSPEVQRGRISMQGTVRNIRIQIDPGW